MPRVELGRRLTVRGIGAPAGLVLVAPSGIPIRLPFRSMVFRQKGEAELLLSLPTDRILRRNLENVGISDRAALTDNIYQELAHYQKIKGTTEALLTMLRSDFFNTLEAGVQEFGKLGIPTLIIWGREDGSLPV